METVKQGDIVVFHPLHETGNTPRAAIVIEAHEDGTADICVFNGYALGTTDYKDVAPADLELAADPGLPPAE